MPQQDSLEITAGAFGRLLRFWRQSRKLSQEAVALEIDSSIRHISFLETGKSLPSRAIVRRLAEFLGLNLRETNNLLAASGYAPISVGLDAVSGQSAESRWLRKSLIHTLIGLEPYPTIIMDRHGDAVMVNRALVEIIGGRAEQVRTDPGFNILELFTGDLGLKPYIRNWEDTICALLVTLQQEVLMFQQETAASLLQRLLRDKDIPADWRQRGSRHMNVSGLQTTTCFPGEQPQQHLHVVHTVGATSFVSEPRLMIYTIYPRDMSLGEEWAERIRGKEIRHPLLPY